MYPFCIRYVNDVIFRVYKIVRNCKFIAFEPFQTNFLRCMHSNSNENEKKQQHYSDIIYRKIVFFLLSFFSSLSMLNLKKGRWRYLSNFLQLTKYENYCTVFYYMKFAPRWGNLKVKVCFNKLYKRYFALIAFHLPTDAIY